MIHVYMYSSIWIFGYNSVQFSELFWPFYVQNILLFGCLVFKPRCSFVWRRGLIWKPQATRRHTKNVLWLIFLSKLRCIFSKLTHILYPSSILFAQLDVHRVQFSLQLPLHANIIAAPMGNWSASSSICMHLLFYRFWQLLKWFCSSIILSCIFSFFLFSNAKYILIFKDAIYFKCFKSRNIQIQMMSLVIPLVNQYD